MVSEGLRLIMREKIQTMDLVTHYVISFDTHQHFSPLFITGCDQLDYSVE